MATSHDADAAAEAAPVPAPATAPAPAGDQKVRPPSERVQQQAARRHAHVGDAALDSGWRVHVLPTEAQADITRRSKLPLDQRNAVPVDRNMRTSKLARLAQRAGSLRTSRGVILPMRRFLYQRLHGYLNKAFTILRSSKPRRSTLLARDVREAFRSDLAVHGVYDALDPNGSGRVVMRPRKPKTGAKSKSKAKAAAAASSSSSSSEVKAEPTAAAAAPAAANDMEVDDDDDEEEEDKDYEDEGDDDEEDEDVDMAPKPAAAPKRRTAVKSKAAPKAAKKTKSAAAAATAAA